MSGREETSRRIAKRIKSALKKRKMTIAELGERLGVGRATVSAWAQAKNNPPVWRLHEIAKLLNVPLEYFLADDEELAETMIDEVALLNMYRDMNKRQRKALVNLLEILTS